MLPPFLTLRVTSTNSEPFLDAIFEHKSPIGPIRTLWWPAISKKEIPSTVLLFIPGNPGILDFYTPFLTALHDKDETSTLAIMAHSHIDHSPEIDDLHAQQVSCFSLPTQVQSALEAYDAIRKYYGPKTRVILIGHSVGAWVALQDDVKSAFLLFPTLTCISKTPNGQLLARFFAPVPRYIISMLSYCTRLVPDTVLSAIFASWPAPQLRGLRMLLNSPQAIRAALAMADSEMQEIKDLDSSLLVNNRERLYLYFAEQDHWVGDYREVVLNSFGPDVESVRIVHGHRDIPHAFCINHGEQVASQCHEWLTLSPSPLLCKMAGLSSDPADLFASPLSEATPSPSAMSQKKHNFYIIPPRLPAHKKRLYKPFDEVPLVAELMEVIGEYNDDGKLYYFARYGDNLAHKFPAQPFSREYPEIVAKYRRKKASGDLVSFDPSASYVHPASRIKKQFTIKLKKSSAANGTQSLTKARSVSDSEDMYQDFSGESELDSDDYEDQSDRRQARTSKRSTRHTRELPFSPRKSRLRRIYTIDDSDESDSEERRASRRSTRRKPVKVAIRLEDSSQFSADDDVRESSSLRRAARPRKERQKKAIQPEYGVVHAVSDIEHESDDELDELAPLRRHRHICEKCHEAAAHILLREHKKPRKGRPSRAKDEFEESGDEASRLQSLGGWIRCLKCPVVAHWKCLSSLQRDEILKAIKEKRSAEQATLHDMVDKAQKRSELDTQETTDFVCGACTKGGICIGCLEVTTAPPGATDAPALSAKPTIQSDAEQEKFQQHLLFRCFTCRRPAHYEHLPRPQALPEGSSVAETAKYYQKDKKWLCADCSSYIYSLDKILAWRPYPPNVLESPNEPPNYKDPLPREYLVKWIGRSYRRTQWVPHMWLLSTNQAKLKNFIHGGSRVLMDHDKKSSRIQEPVDMSEHTPDIPDASPQGPLSLDAFPDAMQHIPLTWKTVDRVMDVLLWRPDSNGKRSNSSHSDSDAEIIEPKLAAEYAAVFENGKEPSSRNTETVSQWEARKKRLITPEDVDQVVWVFVKWNELNYDEATWDSPPRKGEHGYDSFIEAFVRYIQSRGVKIPKYSESEAKRFEARPRDNYRHHHLLKKAADLQLGQAPELQLLPFQVDGFNWLCNNWYNHQPCILADEMGLGKTVQIATFLGNILAKFQAMPALVVVPNSTITNWVRELERWAPNLRVVPFYGHRKAREIVKKFELHHEKPPKSCTRAKFHVLVATYDTLLNKGDFSPVFKSEPRWEVLIVDEGQRLKNDASLLFKRLNELNSRHRIIMTGTPLNNNIRELFNLMNFLDPDNWNDLDALEKEYEELTEDLVKELHNRLRPYFLRRIKSEVLELPPKNEVIVPVSMAPLQQEVYRSILSNNVDILKGLTHVTNTRSNAAKKNVHNVLMQLRKCLQHPYLYDNDIEPRELPPKETHEKLIDGSAKLRLLRALLPKLKARGHRILLFSQFVIALDVIEDFLQGEGYRFLRLDGNTGTSDRQKGMDEFNRPGSDVFIYLLTTRAGGVGINLYTADTVIIFDPDFNPHQAISRAYRYGQQRTCLVFKLMVKGSAEERIMQIGKKKLVLDHLIVQKMDDDDSVGEDVQSILTFGANALFEANQESRDIIYTDQDIDRLIEKTEQEGERQEEVKEGAFTFSFAKVWTADKETMEEIQDDDQGDSWAQTLQKITAERDKLRMQEEVVAAGRGVRRAAAHKPNYVYDGMDGPSQKGKKNIKSKPTVSDSSSYSGSDIESDEGSEKSMAMDLGPDLRLINEGVDKKARQMKGNLSTAATNGMYPKQSNLLAGATDAAECGLCGQVHGAGLGECFMTDKSAYLAEYREMLILHATDEPWELRNAAIRAIDETLHKRGHLPLIAGQPLHPLRENSMLVVSSSKQSSSQSGGGHVSGSLKRPASPTSETAKKKPKPSLSTSACPICNQSPYHLVKDCPVVREGPDSIAQQIRRLESTADAAMIQTVDILRNILNKQKKGDGE